KINCSVTSFCGVVSSDVRGISDLCPCASVTSFPGLCANPIWRVRYEYVSLQPVCDFEAIPVVQRHVVVLVVRGGHLFVSYKFSQPLPALTKVSHPSYIRIGQRLKLFTTNRRMRGATESGAVTGGRGPVVFHLCFDKFPLGTPFGEVLGTIRLGPGRLFLLLDTGRLFTLECYIAVALTQHRCVDL